MPDRDPTSPLRELIEGCSAQSEDRMRAVLGDQMTAYVTNAEGGVDRVHGRDAYLQRLLALKAPVFTVEVTQSVAVSSD